MIMLIVKAAIVAALFITISDIMYAIECRLCELIAFLNKVFEMFAGLKPILYTPEVGKLVYDSTTGGAQQVLETADYYEKTTLIQMIFGNSTINVIYWRMALIGIAMVFAFAIFAVIKKMFDVNDKMKQTLGDVIGNSVKAIILICSMSAIVTVALSGSQILLNAMADAFDDAASQDITVTIEYDEEDYAAMLRSINTIANYSLNKHYDSRYNLNACYNDIREDLEYLTEKGKFKYPYRFDIIETKEEQQEDGSVITVETKTRTGEDTWQSVLYEIAAFDNGSDVYLDSYDEARNETILYAMDVIRNKADFHALDKYTVTRYGSGQGEVAIDRMVMLLGTIDAADNSKYNTNMSFTDELRGQYLYGYRDIYDHSDMEAGFNYFIFVWHHILVIFIAILFLKQYLGMCFNAVARILNMLFLYLVAPPFLAVMPLDDGGKAKQWTTAFIIQTFSLFGTVLSMRLFLVLIPIVVNTNVIFFPDDSKAQMLTQVIFLLGCAYVVSKAGGMITGILADNAGMQAITAGDMMAEASGVVDTAKGAITGAASFVGGQLMGIAGDVQGMMGSGGGDDDKEGEGEGNAEVSTTEAEETPPSQNENAEEPPGQSDQDDPTKKKPDISPISTSPTSPTSTTGTISPNTGVKSEQVPPKQNMGDNNNAMGEAAEPKPDTDGTGIAPGKENNNNLPNSQNNIEDGNQNADQKNDDQNTDQNADQNSQKDGEGEQVPQQQNADEDNEPEGQMEEPQPDEGVPSSNNPEANGENKLPDNQNNNGGGNQNANQTNNNQNSVQSPNQDDDKDDDGKVLPNQQAQVFPSDSANGKNEEEDESQKQNAQMPSNLGGPDSGNIGNDNSGEGNPQEQGPEGGVDNVSNNGGEDVPAQQNDQGGGQSRKMEQIPNAFNLGGSLGEEL